MKSFFCTPPFSTSSDFASETLEATISHRCDKSFRETMVGAALTLCQNDYGLMRGGASEERCISEGGAREEPGKSEGGREQVINDFGLPFSFLASRHHRHYCNENQGKASSRKGKASFGAKPPTAHEPPRWHKPPKEY